MAQHTALEIFAPLLGAVVFAGMVAYGFLAGRMPTKYGPDPEKNELPIAFWAVGAIYGLGFLGCLIWFVAVLLS